MAINFPSSPSNGQTYTENGVTYEYNSADSRWDRVPSTWINDGSFIYYNGPLNLGIGTETPSAKLTVNGTFNSQGVSTFDDNLIVDNDTLFVNVTNDRVGINTASPNAALEVSGSAIINDDSNPTLQIVTDSFSSVQANLEMRGARTISTGIIARHLYVNNLLAGDVTSVQIDVNGEGDFNFVTGRLRVDDNLVYHEGNTDLFVRSDIPDTISYNDTVANAAFNGLTINHDISGSDTLTSSNIHSALRINVDSSATGGDTTNEHRIYGTYVTIDVNGDSDIVYGSYNQVTGRHTSGTVSSLVGNFNISRTQSGGTYNNVIGTLSIGQAFSDSASVGNIYGIQARADIIAGQSATVVRGSQSRINVEGDATALRAVESLIDFRSGNIANSYLFFGSTVGTEIGNVYGVYLDDFNPSVMGNIKIGSPGISNIALECDTTDAILLPSGTIAQRPVASSGMIRYNSELSQFEGYTTDWINLLSPRFDDLSNKDSGTGNYYTTGRFVAGQGSGSAALTTNDGYGNANVTFNHEAGIPDISGSACRIETAVDSTTAVMAFELSDNVTNGVAVGLSSVLELRTTFAQVSQQLRANAGLRVRGAIEEEVFALSGTNVNLNPINGTIQTHTLSGNTTYTDLLADGQSILLMIDDGANHTVTWPAMTWVNNGGVPPVLETTGYTVISLWHVDGTLYGALIND